MTERPSWEVFVRALRQPMRIHFGPFADLQRRNLFLDRIGDHPAFNLHPHPLLYVRKLLALSSLCNNSAAQLEMDKLTGVLIGCGGIARRHLAALAELPQVEVA